MFKIPLLWLNWSLLTSGVLGSPCVNEHIYCDRWAERGECEVNSKYMLESCPKACHQCSCGDNNPKCGEWVSSGECSINPAYMLVHCRASCKQCVRLLDVETSSCQDANVKCAEWANTGECSINPSYMLVNCKSSCGKCTLSHETYNDTLQPDTKVDPCIENPIDPSNNCPALIELHFI